MQSGSGAGARGAASAATRTQDVMSVVCGPCRRFKVTRPPTRKGLTHARIVNVASSIIRRSGYDGTGVADVMKEAGLTHGGFYAHFDSRTRLRAEAADRAGAETLERMRKVTDRAAPPQALDAFVEAYLSDGQVASPEAGCALATLGTETPRQAAEVRQVGARRLKGMVDLVERQMPGWGQPGQHEKALGVLSCLVGAMVLARVADHERLSVAVRDAAKTFIDATSLGFDPIKKYDDRNISGCAAHDGTGSSRGPCWCGCRCSTAIRPCWRPARCTCEPWRRCMASSDWRWRCTLLCRARAGCSSRIGERRAPARGRAWGLARAARKSRLGRRVHRPGHRVGGVWPRQRIGDHGRSVVRPGPLAARGAVPVDMGRLGT